MGTFFLKISVLLWFGLSVCYLFRPDSCASITLWPAWMWTLPGLLIAALGWRRDAKPIVASMALMWLVYTIAFSEEPKSLIHHRLLKSPEWQAAKRQRKALRVVSLNCAGGSSEAAAEVIAEDPDIVLLQESPGRNEVRAIAGRLFGRESGVAWGRDASVLCRGVVAPAGLPTALSLSMTQTYGRLYNGVEAAIISLRLTPPVFRLDLWSPDCWREQTENRRVRRRELEMVVRQMSSIPASLPLILGGDFNAPAGDAIFRLLRSRMHDGFSEGGAGWGNTVLNDTPVSRFDQIWVSDQFRSMTTVARKTHHSDHRMVVSELVMR